MTAVVTKPMALHTMGGGNAANAAAGYAAHDSGVASPEQSEAWVTVRVSPS